MNKLLRVFVNDWHNDVQPSLMILGKVLLIGLVSATLLYIGGFWDPKDENQMIILVTVLIVTYIFLRIKQKYSQ